MRRRIFDVRKICSHPRAQQSKCADSYYVFYGRQWRFSVDAQAGRHIETRAEALRLADDEKNKGWKQQIDDGTFRKRETGVPTRRPGDALTLRGFSERYLKECSAPKRAGRELKDAQDPDFYVFQPMLTFDYRGTPLGDRPFAEVTETMFDAYVADRRKHGLAASTVNKDVALIKAMCKWAARRNLYGPYGVNPISGDSNVLKRKDHARRYRPITEEMLAAIQKHADPLLWAYIELALITCMRLTELYRARWSDWEGLQLNIRPEATKVASGQRKAPLNDRAIAILTWLRVDPAGDHYPDSDFIFGVCGEEPVGINDRFNTVLLKAFPAKDADGTPLPIAWAKGVHGQAARKRLEQINILFGDLRHEGALIKYRAGWGLNAIQRLLGHTTLTQTSTYLGVGDEETLQAMSTLGSGVKTDSEKSTTNLIYQELPKTSPKPGPKKGGKQELTH